uniref:Zf-Sec23_Sec24 domain-containing protein n=1 Tax=Mesocestoides corti TaxID=53468 RepID=A0A5K3FJG6_MESCO
MQQQPPFSAAGYQPYMYPQSPKPAPAVNGIASQPPNGLPSLQPQNCPPGPQMMYNTSTTAEGALANQIGAMSLSQSEQPPASPYQGYTSSQQPMANYTQMMPVGNYPPPIDATNTVGSPIAPPGPQLPPLNASASQHQRQQYPQQTYNQQPPPYQTGFPPMGMIPPTSPPMHPPQPPAAPKAPSARAMADNMPNAVEVIENDRSRRGGVAFLTGPTGVAPPLSTTDFACRDEGNCNPRFIRSSLYNVPTSSDLLKQIGLPFVLSIQPFAPLHRDDQPLILTDMGPQGPVRCVRCKAYMNPFFVFIDGGRRFQCSMCGASTEVPPDYFAHLDHTGRRIDAFQRPELCLGSYEVVATNEYCKNNEPPLPPAFIFLLDVSHTSVRSGLVNLFCSRFITDILPNLPRDDQDVASGAVSADSQSPISIGFITYDSQLHFYTLVRPGTAGAEPVSKPHMSVVADTADVFVPSVDGFLVPPNPTILTNLLSTIPGQFISVQGANAQASPSPDPILAPAVQAGLEALKAANRCGKLFIMHSCLPTADAPGKLKFREDRHLIGTDREKTLLQPATDYYTKLGKDCVEAGASVDLFLFPNSFVDVATIGEVPKLTSGNLYKYSYFQADIQGEQFLADLRKAVARPKAFNAVMRVRTSTGTRPFESLGNVNLPNTTDVELAAVDSNQAISCEIKYDDKLSDNDLVFIQAAILYTSVGGHRRLRIHNLSLSTSSAPADIYRLADLDTYMTWLAKLAIQQSVAKTSVQILTDFTAKVAHTLAGYRKLCTNSGGPYGGGNPGELVLPETIKLLPLYTQCLMKSEPLKSAKNSTIDDRAYMRFLLNSMGPKETNNFLYPRIYPLHDIDPEKTTELPSAIRCSFERLAPGGVYFIENGVHALMWCGLKVNPTWIQQVFGVTDVHVLEPEKVVLTEYDNPLSKCICRLVLP